LGGSAIGARVVHRVVDASLCAPLRRGLTDEMVMRSRAKKSTLILKSDALGGLGLNPAPKKRLGNQPAAQEEGS
jgi:hypothetical protein